MRSTDGPVKLSSHWGHQTPALDSLSVCAWGSRMARQKREDFPGAWHHVVHGGARRAPIFKTPADCEGFLDVVGEMVSRFGVENANWVSDTVI